MLKDYHRAAIRLGAYEADSHERDSWLMMGSRPVLTTFMASIYDIAATKTVDCPNCQQSAGKQCLNRSGRETPSVHWQRRTALQQWRRRGNEDRYKLLMAGQEYGMSGC